MLDAPGGRRIDPGRDKQIVVSCFSRNEQVLRKSIGLQGLDHVHLERIHRPRAEPSDNSAKKLKAKAYGTGIYEKILAEDKDRAKRKLDLTMDLDSEPSIILGTPQIKSIRVSSLCPPLRRRFLHPGGEESLGVFSFYGLAWVHYALHSTSEWP